MRQLLTEVCSFRCWAEVWACCCFLLRWNFGRYGTASRLRSISRHRLRAGLLPGNRRVRHGARLLGTHRPQETQEASAGDGKSFGPSLPTLPDHRWVALALILTGRFTIRLPTAFPLWNPVGASLLLSVPPQGQILSRAAQRLRAQLRNVLSLLSAKRRLHRRPADVSLNTRWIEDRAAPTERQCRSFRPTVSPALLPNLGIGLRQGRGFTRRQTIGPLSPSLTTPWPDISGLAEASSANGSASAIAIPSG